MHLSWSGLIILCDLRSHSTAAALLHGGSTSGAIIGRRAWVAQLTMLIPGSQSPAALFKSLPCRSLRLVSETYLDVFHAGRMCQMLLASEQTLSDTGFAKYHHQHQLHTKSSSILSLCSEMSGFVCCLRLIVSPSCQAYNGDQGCSPQI